MRRRAILSLAGSCLLAACAHQGGPITPGMAWSLHHSAGEGAKLAFGQPASDNVLLMMTCAPRSNAVRVSLTAAPGAPATIELASGEARNRLRGEIAPAMGEGAVLIEADAPADAAALSRFAQTGELAVIEGGRRAELPARRQEKAAVADFFATCHGRA
jgi:hypothetical protein